jgi:DNA-binding CsgD family transcriptional regulator
VTNQAAPPLVGREREAAALERFADELAKGGRAASIVRGDPGIGKTALWHLGIEASEAAGVRVLSTRCAESEMPIAVGALADLVENSFADIEGALPSPQREALAAAIGVEDTASPTPDRIALPRAVSASLRLLADGGPVLVAIDDAQWLDPVSLRLLAFALRRTGDHPIGALVTIRGSVADPLKLADSYEPDRFQELHPRPLSAGALGEMLRSRLEVHLPRPALKRVHDASQGNPMYGLELARSLGEADLGSLVQLRLPDSLQQLVRERVERLPPELSPVLETAAVVDRPTARIVRKALGDADEADALLDRAVTAGVLAVASDGGIRFTHPLIAAAVYGAVPPARRRALHARLAAILEDAEERAQHLALATEDPDPGVAAELDAAAHHAAARGAPDAAAALAGEARRLTPSGERSSWADRGLAEAEYRAESCDFARARLTVDELLNEDLHGPTRARALQLRYLFSPPPPIREATALLESAVEEASTDRDLHLKLVGWLASDRRYAGDYAGAENLAREAVRLAEESGDPALSAFSAALLFTIGRLRGAPAPRNLEGMPSLERGGRLAGEPPTEMLLARERCEAGYLAAARRLLEREAAGCEARGEELSRSGALFDLADVEWRAGNWGLASRYLDESMLTNSDGENHFGVAEIRCSQALLAAHRGREAEARSHAAEAIDRGEEWGWDEFIARARWIVGFLELSLGEPRRAWAELSGVSDTIAAIGLEEPGHLPAEPDIIETLVALTRFDEAAAHLENLERRAEEQEHVWARPAALRCRALLELGRGEAERALEHADLAAAAFEETGHRFDRGRSLLTAGEALRRIGRRREAAERLRGALEVFEEVGAPLWIERSNREMRRASPRPRSDDELTAAERRVAALVVAGRTNREVAAELFTTVSTVEAHLTRIYRKAEVRSRTELARRAAEGGLELDGP